MTLYSGAGRISVFTCIIIGYGFFLFFPLPSIDGATSTQLNECRLFGISDDQCNDSMINEKRRTLQATDGNSNMQQAGTQNPFLKQFLAWPVLPITLGSAMAIGTAAYVIHAKYPRRRKMSYKPGEAEKIEGIVSNFSWQGPWYPIRFRVERSDQEGNRLQPIDCELKTSGYGYTGTVNNGDRVSFNARLKPGEVLELLEFTNITTGVIVRKK